MGDFHPLAILILIGLLGFGFLAGNDGDSSGVFAAIGIIFAILVLLAALGEISV